MRADVRLVVVDRLQARTKEGAVREMVDALYAAVIVSARLAAVGFIGLLPA
jgi:hypothetical protein